MDPKLTKARGRTFNGDPSPKEQAKLEALMTNKDILRQQTQYLSKLPNYSLDKILKM